MTNLDHCVKLTNEFADYMDVLLNAVKLAPTLFVQTAKFSDALRHIQDSGNLGIVSAPGTRPR